MKILFIGKFFPIQGGEATKSYWLMKKMVEYGHQVTILTDTTHYQEHQLCEREVSLEKELSIFKYIDLKYSNHINLDILIEDEISKEKPDIIFGWYLFPFATSAVKIALKNNIPVVIQHAGSDIKKLINLPEKELNEYISLYAKANIFFSYSNTINILKSLDLKNIEENIPCISQIFFEQNNITNNDKVLVLGSKNKSKGYEIIRSLSNETEIKVDWYGSGLKKEKGKYFNTYQSIAPWKIPSLISEYKYLMYAEDKFNVETHESRIPLEAVASGKCVLMSSNLKGKYKNFDDFIIYFDINNKKSFDKAYQFIEKNNNELQLKLNKFIMNNGFSDEEWYENIELKLMQILKGK